MAFYVKSYLDLEILPFGLISHFVRRFYVNSSSQLQFLVIARTTF